MHKQNSKLVAKGQLPRIAARADEMLEGYLRDWARVVEWRLAGNTGYPAGGESGTDRAAQLRGSVSEVGCRYLDIERHLVDGGLTRRMIHWLYVGSGSTVRGFVAEMMGRERDSAGLVGVMTGAYERMLRRWRRSTARSLGLWELAAKDMDALAGLGRPAKWTSAQAVTGLPGYTAATPGDYDTLRRMGVLV